MTRGWAAGAAIASVALLAGCGGSSPTPEQKWAESVCSTITTWQDAVKSAANDAESQIKSPSAGTVDAIQKDVTAAVDATNTMTTDLKKIGPPDTPAGAEAKKQIDTFTTQLDTTAATVKKTVSGLSSSSSLTDVIEHLSKLAPSLQALSTTTTNAVNAIQASSSALKDGFQKADSCKPYRS
jgi:hypothetical protein